MAPRAIFCVAIFTAALSSAFTAPRPSAVSLARRAPARVAPLRAESKKPKKGEISDDFKRRLVAEIETCGGPRRCFGALRPPLAGGAPRTSPAGGLSREQPPSLSRRP